MDPKKTLKTILFTVIALILAVVIYLGSSNLVILLTTKDQLSDLETCEVEDNEAFDCILVLGCGVYSDGTPSPFLRDRLETAVSLYESGASDQILVSGDHIDPDYNETGVMKDYCIARGVPEDAVLVDDLGLSTYESMYRAKNTFDIGSAVIVTQEYHLARAVFCANSVELKCRGVKAINSGYTVAAYNYVRECFARSKDFIFCIFGLDPGEPVKNEAGDTVMAAVLYGIMWALAYSVYLILGLRFFAGNFLNCYPKRIRNKTGKKANALGLAYKTAGLVILYLLLIVFAVKHFEIRPVSFLTVIIFAAIVSLTWNITELTLIDLILRYLINPKWLRITHDAEDYRDLKFYIKRFLIGLGFTVASALAFGSLAYFILNVAIWS
ncbi:MAG: YdcF family protein [Saccharofermentans sp.]|nr:YdcF family protein [Saccharofermentans sp.]